MSVGPSNIIAAIPNWTFEDYATTLTPYEYIYAMRTDPFKQRQMLEIIAERAREVKYRAFKATYGNYIKVLKAALDNPFANKTDFDGQPIELDCGKYVCDDMGITMENDWGKDVIVCSHPILPIRRLINIDTGEVKQELAFRRGKTWRTAIFEKTTLSSAQKIVQLSAWGIGVDSENARDMVAYLSAMENMNYDAIPEAKSVGRLGWVDGYGFSPYVDGLVFDGNESYRHMFESVRSQGSKEKWMELARKVRSGKSIAARVVLATSFASVLVRPLNALPFIVHLWGGAGSGKTMGLMLAASVWACPIDGDYIKTLNSTAVANELGAGFCGSLPFCLDELQLVKEKKTFDETIYMLCQGTGKARGSKSGGLQKMVTWRNAIITTGEQPITSGNSGAGAVNRVLEMDCKDEKLFEDFHEAVGVLQKNYGHAGKAFIDALKREDAKEVMQSLQHTYFEQLAGKATDKQALSASIVLTADALLDLLLFDDGKVLKVDDIMPFLATKDGADANKRAYDWIMDFVASNPNKFRASAGGDYVGECWGCRDKQFVYIIKSVFDREMQSAGYSSQSFLSWARRRGFIECSATESRYTKKKRVRSGDVPVWCIWVRVPDEDGVIDESGNTILTGEGYESVVQETF